MNTQRHPWDYPECPECDSEIFVDKNSNNNYDYICQKCETDFDVEDNAKS